MHPGISKVLHPGNVLRSTTWKHTILHSESLMSAASFPANMLNFAFWKQAQFCKLETFSILHPESLMSARILEKCSILHT
jgi:hypothetical protein